MNKNLGKMTSEKRKEAKNKKMREMESKLTESQLDWYRRIKDNTK